MIIVYNINFITYIFLITVAAKIKMCASSLSINSEENQTYNQCDLRRFLQKLVKMHPSF